jgi:hypothetical protein
MIITLVLPIGMATAEGTAMAIGVLYLAYMLSVGVLIYAVRQMARAVTTLFRILLGFVVLAALGTATVGVIGHIALALGLS